MSASWQSDFIHINGIRLHYTRTGGEKPPVVLAHGVTDDGLCWSPVTAALAAAYDVIMVDARGHGLSDAPLEGYGPIEQADDLAGLIRGLDLQSPIILGHSMGAIATLVLAARYPQLPLAIALEDPPPWWAPTFDRPFTPDWQVGMRAWITSLQQQPRQALIDAQRAETPHWSDAELGPWAEAKLRFNLNFFNRLSDPQLDWPALLRQVKCPALLITGDPAAGALVTPQAALALKEQMPQLEIAHIAGAGHSIRRDQFERYQQVLQPFFTSHAR
jgi:pimeloyl-ACP methyl ester carboxylesterase